MSDSEPTKYEIEGRADKAWKLARVLRKAGVDHELAASYSSEQWDLAASVAGLNPPSERTKGYVVGLLTPNPTLRKAE